MKGKYVKAHSPLMSVIRSKSVLTVITYPSEYFYMYLSNHGINRHSYLSIHPIHSLTYPSPSI